MKAKNKKINIHIDKVVENITIIPTTNIEEVKCYISGKLIETVSLYYEDGQK